MENANKDLNVYQESLLKKRKRDDADQRRRVDARAKQKMDQGRHKKLAEKEAAGKNILMPEIFVSNHMKQQRNYVHYKRNKSRIELSEKAASRFGKKEGAYTARTAPQSRANENALLLVVRIKGYNTATSPQAQKILSDMGLRQINNAVFLHTTQANLTKITLIKEYIAFGIQPR